VSAPSAKDSSSSLTLSIILVFMISIDTGLLLSIITIQFISA
jgi:hypothetical protein